MTAIVEFNNNQYDHASLRALCSNAPLIDLKSEELSTEHSVVVTGEVTNQKNTIVTRFEGKYVILVKGTDQKHAWLISKPALKRALVSTQVQEVMEESTPVKFTPKAPTRQFKRQSNRNRNYS